MRLLSWRELNTVIPFFLCLMGIFYTFSFKTNPNFNILFSVGLLNSSPWPWTGISSRGKPFSMINHFFHHFKNTLTISSTTWKGISFQWVCMTQDCDTSGQGVDSLILVCQQRKSEHERWERRQINQIYTTRRNVGTPPFYSLVIFWVGLISKYKRACSRGKNEGG